MKKYEIEIRAYHRTVVEAENEDQATEIAADIGLTWDSYEGSDVVGVIELPAHPEQNDD